uniref:SFRICE_036208 n=1 Tax=Spodoptera frugiperda TaxID=7108 RepID=A0A2H1WTI5_SPOFR
MTVGGQLKPQSGKGRQGREEWADQKESGLTIYWIQQEEIGKILLRIETSGRNWRRPSPVEGPKPKTIY